MSHGRILLGDGRVLQDDAVEAVAILEGGEDDGGDASSVQEFVEGGAAVPPARSEDALEQSHVEDTGDAVDEAADDGEVTEAGVDEGTQADASDEDYSALRRFVIDDCKLKPKHLEVLIENEVDLLTLLICDEKDLASIGLKAGPRIKMKQKIKQCHVQQTPASPPPTTSTHAMTLPPAVPQTVAGPPPSALPPTTSTNATTLPFAVPQTPAGPPPPAPPPPPPPQSPSVPVRPRQRGQFLAEVAAGVCLTPVQDRQRRALAPMGGNAPASVRALAAGLASLRRNVRASSESEGSRSWR
jgi:hypothetical protein